MRFKEFKIIVETVAETQDILRLSTEILDYIYLTKDNIVPGAIMYPSLIPGIKASTPAGQTVLNATRIKIVDPKVFKNPRTQADASPFYNGNVDDRAYKDARASREFNKGRMPGMSPEFKDLISFNASNGERLDIRLNIDILDFDKPGYLERATSTLSHELTHHLDTIKGRNTIATVDKAVEAKKAQQRLDQHNEAKKLVTPENPKPPGLLDPKEEKRLIGIVKKSPGSMPTGGSRAYFAETTELNARLTQASGELAEYIKDFKFYSNENLKIAIEHFMATHHITQCFVPFATEAEFYASVGDKLTQEELRKAYANPEFQKLYNRIFKFAQAELEPGGIIKIAQQDGFKNWNKANQALGGKTLKATFVERFIQQVVKGIEVAKDVGKQLLRYNHMADEALQKLLQRAMPALAAKGVFKGIPFVGAAIGLAFGIDRLIKGDLPGAGIEMVSGIGSLITAIPATAYQAARDLYGEYYTYEESGKPAVFEYDVAQDPNGTNQRVKDLADKIADQLKAGIEANRKRIADYKPNYDYTPVLERIITLAAVKKPT